jgi:predicted enzyme related to lactoylglutathione lyase
MADRFVWYEYMSNAMDAAAAFYGEVVGWSVSPWQGSEYSLFETEGRSVGGLMKLPSEACAAGAKPGWIGYVAVADIDAAAARLTAGGGALHKGPWEIAGVGRIAAVADPQGAGFMLSQPAEAGAAPALMERGNVGWHELYTTDWEAAFAFYEEQFGWTKGEALNMGPLGTYQLFASDGVVIGGMMNNEVGGRPLWLFYFVVGDIDAAVARLEKAGGKMLNGPMEVPGGAWVIQAFDPEGAMFALVGSRSSEGESA